jgi:hypothetical protein
VNINTFLGLDAFQTDSAGRHWTHEEVYEAVINAIGYKKVRALLPYKAREFDEAFKSDPYLNYGSLPRRFDWNKAGGCRAIRGGGMVRYIQIRSPVTDLLTGIGINSYSCADGICILKHCARMLVNKEMVV